jgi:hypothetical protein
VGRPGRVGRVGRAARLTEAPSASPGGEAGVTEGACGGLARPGTNPAPMRLFHLSIAYLSLLFALVAVTSVLPLGRW